MNPKELQELEELSIHQRLYICYGLWKAIDLHKNHWLKNQTGELIVFCIIQDI